MPYSTWLKTLATCSLLAVACGDDTTVTPSTPTGTGSSTGDATTTTGLDSSGEPAAVCGNGMLETGEGCDDANEDEADGCSATCEIEPGYTCLAEPSICETVCGDGVVTEDEQCDDDNTDDDDGCDEVCEVENGFGCEGEPSDCATVCGDGWVSDSEGCDDNNADESDGCNAACEIEEGFECDNDFAQPSTCGPVCGDGIVLGDEECDDDNFTPLDGCTNVCTVEPGWACMGNPSMCTTGCGDGIIAGAETCDDGNGDPDDGCTARCSIEPGWVCMDEPSNCITDCGDGMVGGPEECDDGNNDDLDGCDALCITEPGFVCIDEPSDCDTFCGDGMIGGLELCDDLNLDPGDGCSSDCLPEFGWDCTMEPSVCVDMGVLADVTLGSEGGCLLTTLGQVGCFGNNTEGEVGVGFQDEPVFLPMFTLADAAQIGGGDEHNCALLINGEVWCWGDNLGQQMGDAVNPGADQHLPIMIQGLPIVDQLVCGDDHNCVIDNVGAVWCWGDNDNRQLGHGDASTADDGTPLMVVLPGGLTATDLGMAENHSCAVLSDGTAACWGDDDNGQLGDGVSGTDNGVATLVTGLTGVVDIEGGRDNTCALDNLGQVFCWGDNIDGQIGDGTTTDRPLPTLVPLAAPADALTLGNDFACALLNTDQVFCWGEGSDYQLGYGDLIDAESPVEVLDMPPGIDFVDIEAGDRGTCLISAANGRYCWGFSEAGQLGMATRNALTLSNPPAFSGPVVQLALSPSEYRGAMCGVLANGTVECSGDGTLVSTSTITGAASIFNDITRHLSVPTPITGLADVQEMGIGDGFACARTTTQVLCWGDNGQRQLGQGGVSTVDILAPVPVVGLGVVDEIEVGDQYACARTGDVVQCWGDNDNRQTGEAGTTTDQSVPVTLANTVGTIDLELGDNHGCLLRDTGVVSCWGDDIESQLGDNDNNSNDSAVPVDVTGLPAPATQIAVGEDHACATVMGGDVYCWGQGDMGNLGQGNIIDSDTALMVPTVAGTVQLVAGFNYTCARDAAGDLLCWGYGDDGNLGNGGNQVNGIDDYVDPVTFDAASGVTDIVAGNGQTCVLTGLGWQCVGFRSSGQLGDDTTLEPATPVSPQAL